MFKYIVTFLMFMIWGNPAQADNFFAKVNRNPVPLGETFVLTLQYDGNPGSTEPDLTPLKKDFNIYSVGRDYQRRSVNGVVSHTYQWNVVLAPKVSTVARIPAIAFGRFLSRPIQIKVAADTANGKEISKFSIGRSVNNDNPYVQQQIIYTLVLKTKVELQGSLPQFDEETSKDWSIIMLGEPAVSSEIDNGLETKIIEIKYAMFPKKSGKLATPELIFNGYYIDKNKIKRNVFSDAFFDVSMLNGFGVTPGMTKVNLVAQPLTIDVKPIPADNNGGWWLPSSKVNLTSDWDNQLPEFKVGEAVNRQIVISAWGVAENQLPKLSFPTTAGFKQYPENPEYKSLVVDNEAVATMTMNVVYIPQQNGVLQIPEVAVNWYNTVTQKNEKAILPALQVKVSGTSQPVIKNDLSAPVATTEVPTASEPTPSYKMPLTMIGIVIFIAFGGGLFLGWLLVRHNSAQPPRTSRSDSTPQKKIPMNATPKEIRDGVLLWAKTCYPQATIRNLEDVSELFNDAELSTILKQLGAELYAEQKNGFAVDRLKKVMDNLGHRHKKNNREKTSLLPELYK